MLSSSNALYLICIEPKKNRDLLSLIESKLKLDCRRLECNLWVTGTFNNLKANIILVLPQTFNEEVLFHAIRATPNSKFLILSQQNFPDAMRQTLSNTCEFYSLNSAKSNLFSALDKFKEKIEQLPVTSGENSIWSSLNLIGQSNEFLNVLSFIDKSSKCNAQVLIEGETGCGKEVVARAIHYLSSRKDYPFIPVNCGAIPDQLIENELFGHNKGAFTDAKESQTGLAEQADGGTLFLDEIEALSPKGQVCLLRFIEDNLVKPLGSQKSKKVDVRVIAASNMPLAELSSNKLFRQDLLFRLNLLYINLPPLRARKSDIVILADHFMDKYRSQYQQPSKKLEKNTLTWMTEYQWPGNVRELESFIHRLFLLSDQLVEIELNKSECTDEKHSRRKLIDRRQTIQVDCAFNEAKNLAIANFELRYLTWLISSTHGNVTHAANIAAKERRAIGKLFKKYQIDPAQYRNH